MYNRTKTLKQMEETPKGIRYIDLKRVCEYYFGKARHSASSHCVFKTPWQGDPRVNIQNDKGKAKPYQVRQVLKAINQLKASNDL